VPTSLPLFAEALSPEEWLAYHNINLVNGLPEREAVRKALGLPDSPEWRAQADFAKEAARFRGHTAKLGDFSHAVGTLREFIVKKYRTMPLTVAK
jgi:hypothetical protein